MDACDPGINVRNLKRLVKQNTGLELNLTREQICDAYSSRTVNSHFHPWYFLKMGSTC